MALVKYVAPGFTTDAGRLLNDFVEAKSLDFSVFAQLWKKRSFSLVYMGRPSEAELTEFTQEIFCLSARFLTTESPINVRVGAVYLLYALFRNQILVPPLRIRMVREQFEVVAGIRKALAGPKHRTLRYVIDYLCQHGIDWVASPTLLGPMLPGNREQLARDAFEADPALTDSLKSDLTDMAESMAMQKLCQTSCEYMRKKTSMQLVEDVDKGFSEKSCRKLSQFASRLEDLVQGDASAARKTRAGKGIGSRRTYLKLKAMGRKCPDDADPSSVQGSESRQRRSGAEKSENPVQDGRPLSKAEVLKKFNKRMKPKAFRSNREYWGPSEDSETFSKGFAESAYWKEKVLDIDSSGSDDVDSPLPVESVLRL